MTAAIAAAALLPVTASAATDSDVEALRAEIARLKAEYAERITKLEAQVAQLTPEADVGAVAEVDQQVEAEAVAANEPASGAAPESAASSSGSATAFNPAISLILAGNYEPPEQPGGIIRSRASSRPATRSARVTAASASARPS